MSQSATHITDSPKVWKSDENPTGSGWEPTLNEKVPVPFKNFEHLSLRFRNHRTLAVTNDVIN